MELNVLQRQADELSSEERKAS